MHCARDTKGDMRVMRNRAVPRKASTLVLAPLLSLLAPLVASLALTALLFAVFAIHSELTGQDMHMASSVSSYSAGAADFVSAGISSDPGLAGTTQATTTLSLDTQGGTLNRALLAMTCAVLLILDALVFLARLPAASRLLLAVGEVLQGLLAFDSMRTRRPDLTLLPICRV